MKLDDVLKLQVLKLKATTSGYANVRFVDGLLEQEPPVIEVRQMCAKVSVVLYADLENVVTLLDMTKRQFIEAAVSDALQRAHQLIEENDALGQGNL